MQNLNFDLMTKHVNDIFEITIDSKNIKLSLIGAEMTNSANSFSLVFRGPVATVLNQGTYQFTHNSLGEFNIFIVPIDPDEEGQRYEAIFN